MNFLHRLELPESCKPDLITKTFRENAFEFKTQPLTQLDSDIKVNKKISQKVSMIQSNLSILFTLGQEHIGILASIA